MRRLVDYLMLVAAFAFVIAACSRARAESVCGPIASFQKALAEKWGEVPIGGGQVGATVSVLVLTSPDGDSFTILSIDTHGIACIIASGRNWDPGTLPSKPGLPS